MAKRGLRSIGINKIIPAQVDFTKAISGSIVLNNISTPSSVPSGLGNIYVKSDGKLYFKSSMFEETDLMDGNNGLSFNFTSPFLNIEANEAYADTDADGGDWPANFSTGPSTTVDVSIPGAATYTTDGHDFSHPSLGGNPTGNSYRIDASNASAITDQGTTLAISLTGDQDGTPTDFTIDFKNASASNKVVMTLRVTVSNSQTKIALNNLTQHQDASTTTFGSITVNIPFKVSVGGSITTVTRTITVQKIRNGQSARVVNLTAPILAFVYDENGANPVGSTTITATALNTTPGATLIYEFYDITGDAQLQIGTGNTDAFSPQALYSNMPRVIECRLREGDSGQPVLATDQITMVGLKPGKGGYTVVLGNPAHTVPVTNGGSATMTNSGPSFLAAFKGTTRLTLKTSDGNPGTGEFKVTVTTPSNIVTGVDTTAALDTSGVGGGQNKDAIFTDHGGISGNTGLVVYAVNCENAETVSALQTVTKSIQGDDGADGSAGTDARAVSLTATRLAVAYDENSALESNTAITFTATAVNTNGTVYYDFQVGDSTVQNTTSNTYALTTNGVAFSAYPKKIEVLIREGSDSGTIVARDQVTVVALKPGKDGYTVVLSNEAHTVPVTTGGTITYTGSGTNVRVYKGTTELAAVASDATPGANQFTVTGVAVATGTLETPGAISVNTSATPDHILVADHAGTMSDNAVLTVTVNVENLSTIVKTQSLAKSKQGATGAAGADGSDGSAGTNARAVSLTATKQVVTYDGDGTLTDPTNHTDITATALNTAGTVYYEFQVNDSNEQNTTSNTYRLTTSGTSFSDYPKKIEVLIREGADDAAIVARDQFTIFAVKPGKGGYTVAMSNEAHTLPTTTDGTVTYTSSGTSIRVFKGATELVGIGSGTPTLGQYVISAKTVTAGTLNSIGATSVNTSATPDHLLIADHNNMTTDNVLLSISVNIENLVTIVKSQSLAKSKQGSTGATGAAGSQGIQGVTGAQGVAGADVGISVELYEPLVVVGTDAFGTPLSGELNNSETTLFVTKNGTALHYDTTIAVGDTGNPGTDKWAVVENTDIESAHGGSNVNWAGPGTLFSIHDSNPDFITWAAITSMGASAIFRSLTVKVNVGGTIYYPIATQQIVKAVQQNDVLEVGPTVFTQHFIRNDWSTYFWPRISSDQLGTGANNKQFIFYATKISDGTRFGADHDYTGDHDENNSYRVTVTESQPDASTGLVKKDTSTHSSDAELGLGANANPDSGDDYFINIIDNQPSNNLVKTLSPVPGRLISNLIYNDSAGKKHYRRVFQDTLATVVYPPVRTFKFGVYVNFGSSSDIDEFAALKTTGGNSDDYFIPGRSGANTRTEPERMGYVDHADAEVESSAFRYAGTSLSAHDSDPRTTQLEAFENDQQAEDAIISYPGTTMRLTGRAFGQLHCNSFAWNEESRNADIGLDLYKITAAASTFGASRPMTYVGSLVFASTQDSNSGTTLHDLSTDPNPNAKGIQGIVITDGNHAVPDQSAYAANSTTIMKIADTEALVAAVYLKRDSNSHVIPDAGHAFFSVEVEYYDLDAAADSNSAGRAP
tara:strand:+ start:930 stop:5621 length:4692 start_codon:yes stop_codon:yes gene_type:complete